MPRDPRLLAGGRTGLLAMLAVTSLLLAACASTAQRDLPGATPAQPPLDRNALQAEALVFYLELLHRFAKAGPGEQAEIFANVRRDFEAAPTPSSRLRFALAVAIPQHPDSDPALAQRVLRELLEQPEQLTAVEHAAAYLELLKIDRQLSTSAENRRLQGEAERIERERVAVLTRRLQTEVDENARLRRALEDAQSKLDAIATIERETTARKPPRPAP